ncbi:acyltransferase family protein [Gulosibacter chungangensis]|uniref:Acyltransferase n=1 Tax=Gulosibacter chungangensis TaxID=979746 RepID=A0A7J5BB80_9MICO|nr:acyltransferase [Gulosibacter chungangensis]KAB1641712.1 acyltransferase [Gulosibacter chungangensis]
MSVGTPPKVKTGQDLGIYSLRGLAIVLMVAGHVIGVTPDTGMNVAHGSGWRISYELLEDIRMPLFTVLSGFVYAMRPLTDSANYPGLMRGKARRLLIPVLTVGTLFYVMQMAIPGTNNSPEFTDIWHVYTLGYAHFWFALALFIIFAIVAIMDASGWIATKGLFTNEGVVG